MRKERISIVLGTRPEAIKLAPVILALKKRSDSDIQICLTGQHRQMLDQVMGFFGITPDHDLDLMQPGQKLSDLTARAITGIEKYFAEINPDLVIIQGDTTTVYAAALAAFYNGIRIAHVEAGLRTWNKLSPFPEEINRVFVSRLADYHFAPTKKSRENLLREGVPAESIWVTGNTVIDALHIAVGKIRTNPAARWGLPPLPAGKGSRMITITGHRRENFGKGLESICSAVSELAAKFEDTHFIYPVHLNPNVRETVIPFLGNRENIHLIEPLSYPSFVALMDRSVLILTDSGGVQEEAPGLGKPVLVTRDTTERPEAVEAGTVKLVGTDAGLIVAEVSRLLNDRDYYRSMAHAVNPYGDGMAAGRIIDVLAGNGWQQNEDQVG